MKYIIYLMYIAERNVWRYQRGNRNHNWKDRQYNGKKMIKRLTMIYKILQRRLKIKQQKTLKATWVIQVLPPCQYVQPRCNPDTWIRHSFSATGYYPYERDVHYRFVTIINTPLRLEVNIILFLFSFFVSMALCCTFKSWFVCSSF